MSVSGSKEDVLKDIAQRNLSLIELRFDVGRFLFSQLPKRQLTSLQLAVFFEDFANMLQTGLGIPQIILILHETSKEGSVKEVLMTLEEELRQGMSLAEAVGQTQRFPWIVVATLAAGERTGKLLESTLILGRYFRSSYQIKSKMRQALIYPAIVFVVLTIVMFFMALKVVPQLKSFLPSEALQSPVTQMILTASVWLGRYWIIFPLLLLIAMAWIYHFRRYKKLEFQQWIYALPVMGNIFKESALALYLLNLSVLLKSGVSLLKSLEDLNGLTVTPVSRHFAQCREYILGGVSFWAAIEQDKFFPPVIASTLRRGEEMVKVDEYCLTLSEFFNRQVASKVDGLLHLVQPALLALGAGFLIAIASAFLLPIYGSLTNIATGQ